MLCLKPSHHAQRFTHNFNHGELQGENALRWSIFIYILIVSKFSIMVYSNLYVQMMEEVSCQQWIHISKHNVKISWQFFKYWICYELLKLYIKLITIHNQSILHEYGFNTPSYNALNEQKTQYNMVSWHWYLIKQFWRILITKYWNEQWIKRFFTKVFYSFKLLI
jgi:hypothetical protein